MFKAAESSSKSFEVLDLSVQRFNRAIGQPAAVKPAGSVLLHHDEGVQDRLFIAAKKSGEIRRDAVTAMEIKVDRSLQYSE